MKFFPLVLLTALVTPLSAVQIRLSEHQHPVERVITLIEDLQAKAATDESNLQDACNKEGCACSDNMTSFSDEIAHVTQRIEEDSTRIAALQTEIASVTESIKQYKNDIQDNEDSFQKSTKQHKAYTEKHEAQDADYKAAIAALAVAIPLLENAGNVGSFLQQNVELSQIINVAATLREALATTALSAKATTKQLDEMQYFVAHPEQFIGKEAAALVQNPYGEYTSRSTVIVGTLKGMSDTMAADKQKAIEEFEEACENFEKFKTTNRREKATLEHSVDSKTAELSADKTEEANKQKRRSLDTETKKNTEAALEARKDECRNDAQSCAKRGRLAAFEQNGLQRAHKILSEHDFEDAFNTFVQISSTNRRTIVGHVQQLLANTKFGDRVVSALQGHGGEWAFTKIKKMIDQMIVTLKEEDREDIAHKDACERRQSANTQKEAELDQDTRRLANEIELLENRKIRANDELARFTSELEDATAANNDRISAHNAVVAAFRKAQKDDQEAVVVVNKAIAELKKFQEKNDAGHKEEAGGIVSILGMIAEDLEKEISVGKHEHGTAMDDHAKAQSLFQKQAKLLNANMMEQEKALADLDAKVADRDEATQINGEKLTGESELKSALADDCDWISTTFDSRKAKRASEIKGLVEAKAYLDNTEQ